MTEFKKQVRRENMPIAQAVVQKILDSVSKVPHIVLPTGSTVFNGAGNDYDFAIFCGAAPTAPGAAIGHGHRSNMGRAMIATAFRQAGYTMSDGDIVDHYEGGADIRSYRGGPVNVILYTNPDEWNAMKRAHEACVAAAAASPLTKRQRAAIFMAVRDGMDARTIEAYFKARNVRDYI